MREFYFQNNELWCENTNLQTVVKRFGTPLYVYSKKSIIDHCRYIEKAFGKTDHLSCYAVKANMNRTILSIIATEGIGCDVGSIGELYLALEAGFLPNRITYSGVGKRFDEIEFALKKNILEFNVESEGELMEISRIASGLNTVARVLLRINFDVEVDTHPYITTGKKENKFGVDSFEARGVLEKAIRLPSIEVVGIHIHIGSQITNVETFIAAAKTVTKFVIDLRNSGIPMKHLNFGGGFGVQYHDFISHPRLPKNENHAESEVTVANFIEAVVPILAESKCKILIQPGRSIIAHAGILATQVLYFKKKTGRNFIIVDAGMNDFMRPTLYQSHHQIIPISLREGEDQTADIVGPLCETGDFFAIDRQIPKVEQYDYLALMCTGAYGYVLSSNYNGRPRPAEVLIDGENYKLIRQRESLTNL
ncbi:MAG: diaminopimelate decarboxylase [Ignavibacteriales bacterium]|nr:diaminopimelate decarboxylase [Ignavibacteriales bacterium]